MSTMLVLGATRDLGWERNHWLPVVCKLKVIVNVRSESTNDERERSGNNRGLFSNVATRNTGNNTYCASFYWPKDKAVLPGLRSVDQQKATTANSKRSSNMSLPQVCPRQRTPSKRLGLYHCHVLTSFGVRKPKSEQSLSYVHEMTSAKLCLKLILRELPGAKSVRT